MRHLRSSPLVAVFAHAVTTNIWRDPVGLKIPGVAGHFRSLTRRMKQESGWHSAAESLMAQLRVPLPPHSEVQPVAHVLRLDADLAACLEPGATRTFSR